MARSVYRPVHRPMPWLALWLVMIAAVVTGSLLPAREIPAPPFPGADKLEHMAGYAVLAGYAAMLFARGRALAGAALGLVLLGVAIEVAQGTLTTSRSADAFDALANAGGVALGLLVGRTRLGRALQCLDARFAGRGGLRGP